MRADHAAGNPLTNVTLPPALSGITELNLSQNLLTKFTLPTGMTNLEELNLAFNQLTNVALPNGWSAVPISPGSLGGRNAVTNRIDGAAKFFRLREL